MAGFTGHAPNKKTVKTGGDIQVTFDRQGFRETARQIRSQDRALWTQMRHEMKDVADVVARDARSRASWSTRIPGTIRTSATLTGATVTAGGKNAPHAAPYEVGSKRSGAGEFRHPVPRGRTPLYRGRAYKSGRRSSTWVDGNGNEAVWVNQKTRPYMVPALMANLSTVERGLDRLVEKYARQCGFH